MDEEIACVRLNYRQCLSGLMDEAIAHATSELRRPVATGTAAIYLAQQQF